MHGAAHQRAQQNLPKSPRLYSPTSNPARPSLLETTFSTSDAVPIIVLDTNVALDWLLFRDPSCARLGQQLESGQIRWIVSFSMRSELAHVLASYPFDGRPVELCALWSDWDRLAVQTEPVPLFGAAQRLRCTDPDDQIFIDLALAHGARWLLSRDRAVLKLARRAAAFNLAILTPAAWARQVSPPPA